MRVIVWAALVGLLIAINACSPATVTPEPSRATLPPSATLAPVSTATQNVSRPGLSPSPSSSPRISSTPDTKDLLITALNNAIAKVKTYRVRVPEEGRLIEVVLPDRFHQIESDDLILIGNNYWQKSGDIRMRAVANLPFFDRVNLVWIRDQVAKSQGASLLGPSTLSGAQAIGYSFGLPSLRVIPPKTPGATPQATPFVQTIKVWFTMDGLPRIVEYSAPLSVTANFSDINSSIEVNPP